MPLNGQSAIEYLMTYGWAVLVIVVVLAILFLFNVFNGGGAPNTCQSLSNFACVSTPVLNSSGWLGIELGNYGQETVATGIACTNSSASAPSSFSPLPNIDMQNSLSYQLSIKCPVASGAIGSRFNGAVWLQYESGSVSGLVEKVASVSIAVSTTNPLTAAITSTSTTSSSSSSSSSTPSTIVSSTSTTPSTTTTTIGSISYVQITLTNNQGTSTASPFQQLIVVDSAAYSSYINSNWNNVDFTTGPGGTGSTLQAWVETNASNGSPSTRVWVSLPSGIAGSSTATIYMNFMPNPVLSASGPTGESSNLSATYGQYDNGALVFPFYDNFAGSGLDSKWQSIGPTLASQNNRLILTGPNAAVVSTNPVAAGTTFEAFVNNSYNPGWAAVGVLPPYTSGNPADAYSVMYYNSGPGEEGGIAETGAWPGGWGCCADGETGWNGLGFKGGVYGVTWPATGNEVYLIPGTGIRTSSDASMAFGSNIYLMINAYSTWDSGTFVINWARTRAYPPGGVMPSVGFGSVV